MDYRPLEDNQSMSKSRQIEAIRSLRRKLQRKMRVRLTNEEVADYWFKSAYAEYFSGHLHETGKCA